MTRDKVCGTIVYSGNNNILVIQGRKTNKWSFPKGHRYREEADLDCALRETYEETGIKLDPNYESMMSLPTGTYYVYHLATEPELEPRDLNEVIDARWVPAEALKFYYNNYDLRAFFSEKRVMMQKMNIIPFGLAKTNIIDDAQINVLRKHSQLLEEKKQARLRSIKEKIRLDTVIYF